MTINHERLWQRIHAISRITDPESPWTRRSFTPRFAEGRDWLAAEFRAAGLRPIIDAGGNLLGRLEGSDPNSKSIMIGSHSDTVPSGGRYDGILGVMAALEVAHSLGERGERLRHHLEVVDFLAEEPSDFGLSCVGSRALVGGLTDQHLSLTRPDGMTLEEGIASVGGRPAELAALERSAGSIAAYLELHIEQGRVLEMERVPIGIVTDIVGIYRERITITGRADHAGTTPMRLRADALVGAADLIKAVHRHALMTADEPQPLVATIGRIEVEPNAANAVPGRAILTLEVRCGNEAMMPEFRRSLMNELQPKMDDLKLAVTIEPLSQVAPVACAPQIRTAIADTAASLGLPVRDLPSGAGHDGVFVSRICPIGMIFVPCLDGRSHAPEESMTPEQATDGAQVLAGTVRRLDSLMP